jgi:hypothetical protein
MSAVLKTERLHVGLIVRLANIASAYKAHP